jgi:spore maturation protein CgeB
MGDCLEPNMHFVIFGLSVSSSWGNGHATLWRGMLRALARRGHTAVFYEKEVPYYAETKDGWEPPPGIHLRLYRDWHEVLSEVVRILNDVDVVVVTSYYPDGARLSPVLLASRARIKVFYDLDTPMTLEAMQSGRRLEYLPEEGLGGFDLVLSYTGGRALDELKSRLGALRVAPLYGWVDPEIHHPSFAMEEFRSTLSYLGTYAADRQAALEELFAKPAKILREQCFVIGGAQYPDDFPWAPNIYFVRHLHPCLHPSFFNSGRATLNVTRRAMAAYGFCPSGRLFEAAACGTPVLTDTWEGLNTFFAPGSEILPVSTAEDVLAALWLSDRELRAIGEAAQARVLEKHTAMSRAMELERLVEGARRSEPEPALSQ